MPCAYSTTTTTTTAAAAATTTITTDTRTPGFHIKKFISLS